MARQQTIVNGCGAGGFDDATGFVGAHKCRAEYHEATKALRRAERAAAENIHAEKQPTLEGEIVKAQEALSLAEKAVIEYQD